LLTSAAFAVTIRLEAPVLGDGGPIVIGDKPYERTRFWQTDTLASHLSHLPQGDEREVNSLGPDSAPPLVEGSAPPSELAECGSS
jgi:hypothetical protein